MARRRKRAEHDNNDRWLISYADFVTLLFAFFVVMYAISSVNEGKYRVFSDSLSIAFNSKAKSASDTIAPNEQEQMLKALVDRRTARLGGQVVDRRTASLGERQRKIQDRMKELASGLSQVMAPMIGQRLVSINQTARGVVVDISASTLFRTGDAVLQPDTLEVLRQVAAVLSKEELSIEVEGHTDDIPITTRQFPSNWELSSARASSVVRMLIDNGVAAKRLVAVGLAENQPLMPNDSAEGRARNRRVTITIMSPDAEL